MHSEADIRSVVKSAVDHSAAEETELWIGGGKSGLTRFANNEVHQNIELENYVGHFRVLDGRRWGPYTVNRLDERSLEEAAAAAPKIAPPRAGGRARERRRAARRGAHSPLPPPAPRRLRACRRRRPRRVPPGR